MKSKRKKRSLWELIRLVCKITDFGFTMLVASLVMSTVAAGMSVMQGYQQQKIANANAARLRMQADREKAAAERNAQIAAQRRKRERGRATVAFAASGVDISQGSPLIVEAEDDYQSEINEATIRAQGADTAWRSRSQAAIEVAKGSAAVTAGYGRAAGSLASGASLLAEK
tara:strand:- start:2280 stop:2792 length:513 start_codon:yes stop_codon:yes gene_type:complete